MTRRHEDVILERFAAAGMAEAQRMLADKRTRDAINGRAEDKDGGW